MIHLGKLIKGEEDLMKKNNVVIKDDKRQILFQKAMAMQMDNGISFDKLKEEEKKENGRRKLKENGMRYLVEEELKYSKINKTKLISDWRVIMRIAKVDELRKLIEMHIEYFERELDYKNAILEMLDKDIEEAEEHYSIALRNHFIHINQLTCLQESRIKGITEEYNKDVKNLENEFMTEFDQIKKNFEEEQNEIKNMTDAIKVEYNEKKDKVNEEFRIFKEGINSKIKDKYTRLMEKLKKAADGQVSKFHKEIDMFSANSHEKCKQDDDQKKEFQKCEKEINSKRKRAAISNGELKKWKTKIKQNDEDWDNKNESIKNEKNKLMDSYKILKKKLLIFRKGQYNKLSDLVRNSRFCMLKLKEYIKLSEKILKMAEICRRLETEKEKILPFYENSDVIVDDINLPKLFDIAGIDIKFYDEMDCLKFFWKRYNKVLLDVIAIRKQKGEIEKQNKILREIISQYKDGFTVNNDVMKKEMNPLIFINNRISLTNGLDQKPNETLQEAAHMVLDYNKQHNIIIQNITST